jgi:primosomal protein N' (replication factor Y)
MYADIIVDISHDKLDRAFSYSVPEHMERMIKPGMQVVVPFGGGGRQIKGFVVELKDTSDVPAEKIKEIVRIVDENIPLEGRMIQLALFIRNHYGGSMSQALKTVIPVKKSVRPVEKKYVSLAISRDEAKALLEELSVKKNTAARIRLLQALIEAETVEYSLLTGKLSIAAATIRSFEEKGYVRISVEENYRNPVKSHELEDIRHKLNDSQQFIVDTIEEEYTKGKRGTYLIHGVTGSGKTEVYLELIEYVVRQKKQVIFLIPEISLTFQTVMRFYTRFGDRVSVIHSRLSAGERYDQYRRAANGEIDVMIGPRSALFTPFQNPGLIVIDEEHENAYKSESVPKYHAVGVAEELCRMTGASLILGSATPSVDSYYKALNGTYTLFTMKDRANEAKLPAAHLVDLRAELQKGNRSMFSQTLQEMMTERLAKREQIMLFINRRGYYGFLSCRSCGHVLKCPHCDISLTAHNNGTLVCHYCGYRTPAVKTCPKCGSKYISALRGGTQMVEEALLKMFPQARVLRMDADTTAAKDSYDKILSAFMNQEADILVGTQMIVKGHDFPNVTLVGILAADISLYASDYRAAERTFELLTQAAGRAGRGEKPGDVVIQAYDIDNFAIQTAAKQDYVEYYNQEILYRTLLDYPPVSNMLLIKLSSRNERQLELAADMLSITDGQVRVIGPSNAALYKAEDVYHKVIYVKAKEYETLTRVKSEVENFVKDRMEYRNVSIQFDFNPLYT